MVNLLLFNSHKRQLDSKRSLSFCYNPKLYSQPNMSEIGYVFKVSHFSSLWHINILHFFITILCYVKDQFWHFTKGGRLIFNKKYHMIKKRYFAMEDNFKCNREQLDKLFNKDRITQFTNLSKRNINQYIVDKKKNMKSIVLDDQKDNIEAHTTISPSVVFSHPGPKNFIVFNYNGEDHYAFFGHNLTHTSETQGQENLYVGPDENGRNRYLVIEGKISPALKKHELDSVTEQKYQLKPVETVDIFYDHINSGNVPLTVVSGSKTVELNDIHKSLYFSRNRNAAAEHLNIEVLDLGEKKINVLRVDVDDELAKLAIDTRNTLVISTMESSVVIANNNSSISMKLPDGD